MRKCPSCGGKYADHVKKCTACNVPTEEWTEELTPISEYGADDQVEKISPTSIADVRKCSRRFKTAYILTIVLSVVIGVVVYSATQNPAFGVIAFLCGIAGAFTFFMFATLFRALDDIIVALYHIANK